MTTTAPTTSPALYTSGCRCFPELPPSSNWENASAVACAWGLLRNLMHLTTTCETYTVATGLLALSADSWQLGFNSTRHNGVR